jgi:ketosteroid isomerase-like protein
VVRSWLARKLITRNIEALNRGDVGPTLRMEAPEVHFHFPGSNSWAAELTSRDQVEAWLKRMVAAGIQHEIDDVVATGPLWRMTIVLRGRDHAVAPDGTRIYDNRYVIWGTTRWGLIRDYEVYEDTEKATAFDTYLSAGQPVAEPVAASD